jgi:hypothetical protein
MKKHYILVVLVLLGLSLNAQDLVVLDRENVVSGSAPTGNAAGVSSIGLTRGSGIERRTNNANHTSSGWNAVDLSGAQAADEYVEWSFTALTTFTVDLNQLDIRVRRNNNGPQNFQILYSLDGFSSAGIDLTGEQTLATTANTDLSFTSLNVTINEGETISFRLYAWNATNNNGWFRLARNGAFSGLGITNACAVLSGAANSSSPNSIESDIIESASFIYNENINYINFNSNSGLTPANSLQIGEFTIRDGGASNDADSESTILEALTFDIVNADYIQALAIYSGGILMQEVNTVTASTLFDALNGTTGIVAPDDGAVNFEVYATFTSAVEDNEQFQLSISSALAGTSGSLFQFGNAGGAQTSTVGDANRIEVTATGFAYTQNVSDVVRLEPMFPAVQITAVDSKVNLDLDFSDPVAVTSSGSFDPSATTVVNALSGLATFDNLVFNSNGSALSITATASGLSDASSGVFEVGEAPFILAFQNFDGTTGPVWNFTNNVDFFTTGTWGVDPYYGVVDNAVATQLDSPFFTNNILGENQLNDTANGNGTTGRARITFDPVTVTGSTGVQILFDWQVVGYQQNRNDVRYAIRVDGGAWEPWVILFDGNNAPTDEIGRVQIDIPDGSNTVELRIDIRNWLSTGFSGFDNFRVVSDFEELVFKNGIWEPSAPTANSGNADILIDEGFYQVRDDIEVKNVTINPGAIMRIEPGFKVNALGEFNNNGTLQMNSVSCRYSSRAAEAVRDRLTEN